MSVYQALVLIVVISGGGLLMAGVFELLERRRRRDPVREANLKLFRQLEASRRRMIETARAHGRRITWEVW